MNTRISLWKRELSTNSVFIDERRYIGAKWSFERAPSRHCASPKCQPAKKRKLHRNSFTEPVKIDLVHNPIVTETVTRNTFWVLWPKQSEHVLIGTQRMNLTAWSTTMHGYIFGPSFQLTATHASVWNSCFPTRRFLTVQKWGILPLRRMSSWFAGKELVNWQLERTLTWSWKNDEHILYSRLQGQLYNMCCITSTLMFKKIAFVGIDTSRPSSQEASSTNTPYQDCKLLGIIAYFPRWKKICKSILFPTRHIM